MFCATVPSLPARNYHTAMPTLRGKGKGSSTNTSGSRFSLEMADSFLRRRNSNATLESRNSNSTAEEMSESSRRRISLDVPWWRSKSGSYINVRATDFIDAGVSRFSSPPANPTLSPTPVVAKPRPPSVEFRKVDTDVPIEVVPPPTFVKPDDDRLQRLEDAGLRRIPNERDSLPAEEFIIINPDYNEDPTVRQRISWHDPAAASKPPANDILWPRPERPHLVTPAYNGLPPPPTARCFYPSPPPLPTPPLSEQFSLSERDSFDPDYYYNIRTSITSERFSINSDFSGFRQQLSIDSDAVFSEQGDEDVTASVVAQQQDQRDVSADEDTDLGTDNDSEAAPEPELEVEAQPVVEKYESEAEEDTEVREGPNNDDVESEALSELMNDLVDEIVSEVEHEIGKTESVTVEDEEVEPQMEVPVMSEPEPDAVEVSQSDAETELGEDEEEAETESEVTEEPEEAQVDSEGEEEAECVPETKPEAEPAVEVPDASDLVEEAAETATEEEPKTDDEKDDKEEVEVEKEVVEEEPKPVAKDESAREEPKPVAKEESEPKTPAKSTEEVTEKESKSTGKLMKRASNYRLFNRSLTPLPAARTKSRSRLPQMLSRLLDPTETETAPHTSPRKRQFGSRRVSKGALARLKSRRSLETEPTSLESISDENSSRLMNGRLRLSPKASRQSAPTPTVVAGESASVASLDLAAVSVASSDEEFVPSRMA